MDVYVKPGKYVVAVSGGVDSMALLHALKQLPDVQLIVAHFEHGIRADSDEDRRLVASVAKEYDLPFVYARGHLGAGASEAMARDARYAFLRHVMEEQGAVGIITAHHQNDLIETAFINLLRGTGSRGLTALRTTDNLHRPLLDITKQDILAYARDQGLVWREDSTNSDDRYLRNYLRHHVMPKLSDKQRQKALAHIHSAGKLHAAIDRELSPYIGGMELGRAWFISSPHSVASEVLALWLRRHMATFDRKTIERLVVFAKTAANGKRADVDRTHYVVVGKNHITLYAR